jgi:hypothetical protein
MIRTIIAATAAAAALAIPTAAGAAVPHFLADPRTPTDITAVADPPGGLELTGTLSTAAGPVAGATVTFTTNGASRLLCTAVTNVDGLAACAITGAQRTIIRSADGIWYARFAGDATLQPAFRAGHL